MKITRKMKKILLFLLHPEKSFEWFRKNNIHIIEGEPYFEDHNIMVFLENRTDFNFSHSEIVSYRRTFNILEKLGLVEFDGAYHASFGEHWSKGYKLTSKGRKIAEEIKKEIQDIIEEYENLV